MQKELLQFTEFRVLQVLGSTLDGRLDGRDDLRVLVIIGELSHTLKELCRRVGLHELENSSNSELSSFSGVLVDPEENRASHLGVSFSKLVEGNNDGQTLEVSHGLFAFQEGLEDLEDSGVSQVSEGQSQSADLDAVLLLGSLLELLSKVGNVLLDNGLLLLGLEGSKSVDRESVVGGGIADKSLAGQLGEGEDGRGVEELLVLHLGAGRQSLQLISHI